MYKRKVKKPPLNNRDRLFRTLLSGGWRDWASDLIVVKPETVIRWREREFRGFWSGDRKDKRHNPTGPVPGAVPGRETLLRIRRGYLNFPGTVPSRSPQDPSEDDARQITHVCQRTASRHLLGLEYEPEGGVAGDLAED